MIEEWIPINGNETYLISNFGKIKNTDRNSLVNGSIQGGGYVYITMGYNNNSYIRKMAHRLVAEHFIPNPDNKPFVNHIDANRTNNHVLNLEWCTQSENIQHAHNIGNAGGVLSHFALFSKQDILVMKYKYAHGYTIHSLKNEYECGREILRKVISGKSYKMEPFHLPLRKEKRICPKRGSYKNKSL